DMDSHIREYWDFDRTYKEYIDPQYREKFTQLSAAVKANQRRPGDTGVDVLWSFPPRRPLGVPETWEIPESAEGTRVRGATSAGRGRAAPACSGPPQPRRAERNTPQTAPAVMFPSQSDGYCELRDVGFEHALHVAYHRYMNVYCSETGGRLRWVADATMRDMA